MSYLSVFISLLLLQVTLASYPTTKLEGMVGFAAAAGVTGGWSGSTIVEISTLAELEQYVADSTPRVLVITSNIETSTMTKVFMGSNKSIIGSWSTPRLYNIHLRASEDSSNIIIQNIIFQHSVDINGNDDIQVYLNYGSKYWVDHCSFVGHYGDWSYTDGSLDKLLYIGEYADYATISNCYFGNHKYGVILGHPEDDDNTSYDGYPHLTICNNHYENMEVRAPGLMRYGYFHVYSNFINNFNLGFTLATNAKIISENNYFGEGSANNGMLDDKGTGTFTDSGSYPSIDNQVSPKSTWTASSNYAYTAVSATYAKEATSKYAGVQTSTSTFVFGS